MRQPQFLMAVWIIFMSRGRIGDVKKKNWYTMLSLANTAKPMGLVRQK